MKGSYDEESHIIMANMFVPHLKLLKNCVGKGTEFTRKNCHPTLYAANSYSSVVLYDGTIVAFRLISPQCNYRYGNSEQLANYCGTISVDINGRKGPNIVGKDRFHFDFTNFGLIPTGSKDATVITFPTYCDRKKNWG